MSRGIFIASLAVMTLTGCSDDPATEPDPDPGPVPGQTMEVTFGTPQPTTNTMQIEMQMRNVEEYAFCAVEQGTELPEPIVILGSNDVCTAEGERCTITVRGLEAATEYVLAVAVRNNTLGLVERHEVEFATTQYERVLTITDIGLNEMSFHIECEPEQHWRYAIYTWYEYQVRRGAFWPTDSRMLPSGDMAPIFQGPQTITMPDENLRTLPGDSYVILVGECDAEGNYLYEKQDGGEGGIIFRSARPATRALPSDEYTDDDVVWSGFFGKRRFTMQKPAHTELTTQVQEVKLSTRSALFNLTPDAGAYGFAAGILDREGYEQIVEYVGEEGLQAYAAYNFPFKTEPTQFAYQDLQEGEYHLLVTTLGDADATTQSFQHITFRRSLATKPAPQLIVTGIEAPAGETATGPFYCWFNIKAPNRDATYGTYVTMSYDEYLNRVQYGSSAAELVAQNIDMARFTDEALAAVNSDAGLNVCINAWEDTRYALVAGIANDEEVIGAATALNKTPALEPEPRGASDIFGTLQGPWTIAARSYFHTETGWKEFLDIRARTDLALAPDMSDTPDALPESVYEAYALAGVSRGMADAYFDDYLAAAERTEQSYYDRNWVAAHGFELGWDTQFGQYWSSTAYRSPWGLFSGSDYNGAGALDIMRDYGPKLFFHVDGEGRITVSGNTLTIPNVCGYGQAVHLFASTGKTEADGTIRVVDDATFPVELSEDGNRLTIRPIEHGGETYYFTLGMQDWGNSESYRIIYWSPAELVLTRGWEGDDNTTQVTYLMTEEATPAPAIARLPEGRRATRVMPQHNIPASAPVYRREVCRVASPAEMSSAPCAGRYTGR